MIAILGTTGYIASPMVLRLISGSKLLEQLVRVTRSATLDGGGVLFLGGMSMSDKTIKLTSGLTQAEYARLMDLMENETFFTLSCDAGFYTGAIENVTQDKKGVSISFLCCSDDHTIPAVA